MQQPFWVISINNGFKQLDTMVMLTPPKRVRRIERSLPCEGFQCQRPAEWYPTVVGWDKAGNSAMGPFYRINLIVALCDACKNLVGRDEILTEESWPRIFGGLRYAGIVHPDRGRVRIEYTRIEGLAE